MVWKDAEFTEQFWLLNAHFFFSCQLLRNSSKGKECYSSHYYLFSREQIKNVLGKEEFLNRGRRKELSDNFLVNHNLMSQPLVTKLSHLRGSVPHLILCSSHHLTSMATAPHAAPLTELKTPLLPSPQMERRWQHSTGRRQVINN